MKRITLIQVLVNVAFAATLIAQSAALFVVISFILLLLFNFLSVELKWHRDKLDLLWDAVMSG